MFEKVTIRTKQRDHMIEITEQVEKLVREQAIREGAVIVYCPHTTAGITINEMLIPMLKPICCAALMRSILGNMIWTFMRKAIQQLI